MLLPYHVTLVILITSELLSGCFKHIRRSGFGLGFVRVPHYVKSQCCVKVLSPDLQQRRWHWFTQPFVVTPCDALLLGLAHILIYPNHTFQTLPRFVKVKINSISHIQNVTFLVSLLFLVRDAATPIPTNEMQ